MAFTTIFHAPSLSIRYAGLHPNASLGGAGLIAAAVLGRLWCELWGDARPRRGQGCLICQHG